MDYPDSEKGRCRSCGFLSRLRRGRPFSSQRYYEASEEDRKEGELYSQQNTEAEIACYRRTYPLNREVGQEFRPPSGPLSLEDAILTVIGKDRKCPTWVAYTPDFGPKEHLEEWRVQEVVQTNRQLVRAQTDVARNQIKVTLAQAALSIAAIVIAALAVFIAMDGNRIDLLTLAPATPTVVETITPEPESP